MRFHRPWLNEHAQDSSLASTCFLEVLPQFHSSLRLVLPTVSLLGLCLSFNPGFKSRFQMVRFYLCDVGFYLGS